MRNKVHNFRTDYVSHFVDDENNDDDDDDDDSDSSFAIGKNVRFEENSSAKI